jgi:hypothetical protein
VTAVTNRGFVARLGEMLLHQVGQVGGELLYPAISEYLVSVPVNLDRHGRQALRLVLFGGHPQDLILRSLPRPRRRAPTLVRVLNVVLDDLDADPSQLRLYQEVGTFEGDYLSLRKVRKMLPEALQVRPLHRLLRCFCHPILPRYRLSRPARTRPTTSAVQTI